MTVVRMGRKESKDFPMEFTLPDWMTGNIFINLCKDSYREDDLYIEMVEEGEVDEQF